MDCSKEDSFTFLWFAYHILTWTGLEISLLFLILMISVLSIMWRKFKLILLFHLKEEPFKEYLVLCSSVRSVMKWSCTGTSRKQVQSDTVLELRNGNQICNRVSFSEINISVSFPKLFTFVFWSHRGYLAKKIIWIFFKILNKFLSSVYK